MPDPLVVQLYCEMIPPRALLRPPFRTTDAQPLLARMRDRLADRSGRPVELELVIRVTMRDDAPSPVTGGLDADAFELLSLGLRTPAALGIDRLRVWPQLPRALGTWLSVSTSDPFFARLHLLLDALAHAGCPFPPLLYDLEVPSQVLDAIFVRDVSSGARRRELLGLLRRLFRRQTAREDRQMAALAQEVQRVRERAAPTPAVSRDVPLHTAAVFPAGAGRVRRRIECALQVPTVDPETSRPIFDGLEGMCYGSLVGYVLGDRLARLRPLAAPLAVFALSRWHLAWCREISVSCGVILGCTGRGLLGNEPTFRSPTALARAARAAGVRRLARVGVYNLRGLLAEDGTPLSAGRRDWRRWVDALVGIG